MIDLAYELARVDLYFPQIRLNYTSESIQSAWDAMEAEREAEQIHTSYEENGNG